MQLLGTEIKGLKVEKVLVEEKLSIEKEFYVGVIVDPIMNARCPVVMLSTEGGMDIEAVPAERIAQMKVDVLRGFRPLRCAQPCIKLRVPTKLLPALGQAMAGLYQTFRNYNCRIAEINPLVLTKDGKLIADCRIAIDDLRSTDTRIWHRSGPRVAHPSHRV